MNIEEMMEKAGINQEDLKKAGINFEELINGKVDVA